MVVVLLQLVLLIVRSVEVILTEQEDNSQKGTNGTCFETAFLTISPNVKVLYIDKGETFILTVQLARLSWGPSQVMARTSEPNIVFIKAKYVSKEVLSTRVNRDSWEFFITGHKKLQRNKQQMETNVVVAGVSTDSKCNPHIEKKIRVIIGCPPSKSISVEEENFYKNDIVKSIMNKKYSFDDDGNLLVPYLLDDWGCPFTSLYLGNFIPGLQLMSNGKKVGLLSVDFVVHEIHGNEDFAYSNTVEKAGCSWKPQSWSEMIKKCNSCNPDSAWSRENYQSCFVEGPESQLLRDADLSIEYQVLNSAADNKLLWSSESANFYVFEAIVMDSNLSYCDLRTKFAVIIHGLPVKHILPTLVILFSTLIYLSISILVCFCIHYYSLKYKLGVEKKLQIMDEILKQKEK
ncbi:cation channel sperm-associated protein subunit epsilon-like isoform X2 [Limulus polyphemus]|uniref:Cation channel sperm-associated protein subunit epsilon-like isoform X2 n=1 Tax=Limulus polyphemus TaxID=6850 RepID=A0ABM1SWC1_LIMPO|nr:cation channel sperm-associated protein subunit epsilon-like isoform X2 [Limulus polyphemus]